MKAVYQNKSLKPQHHKGRFTAKWDLLKSREGKEAFITFTIMLTILLFMYTAVSKLLDYDKFVFQMRRTPFDIIQLWAPTIGWVVPMVELILVVLLYINRTRFLGMIGSLMLMLSFEVYITWMKVMEMRTGLDLPCTCGGIISTMGWTTHLVFNAIFIFLLTTSIYYERKKEIRTTI